MINRFLAIVGLVVLAACCLTATLSDCLGAQVNSSALPRVNWPRFVTIKLDLLGRVISTEIKKANFITEDLGNGVKLEMVRIKGGVFQMGSQFDQRRIYDDAEPHTVRLSGFAIGKYEVTREQWREVAR